MGMKFAADILISCMLIPTVNNNYIATEPIENPSSVDTGLRTIEEILQELKIQRNKIEQQRLEEIRLKKLEEERLKEESIKNNQGYKDFQKNIQPESKDTKQNINTNDNIPKLIVRLRGKHANKYLCRYKFIKYNNNVEKILEREIITDYSKLLKRNSLKVRPNEKINFEFSEEPKNITVKLVDGQNIKELKMIRNSIEVPNLDKKVLLEIHGVYSDGDIVYAVVLDIRQPN